MANTAWLNSDVTEVSQVDTFTVSGAGGGSETWTVTMTLEDGSTVTVTFVDDGSPTTTEVATGIYNALNGDDNPFIRDITYANPSAGVVTCTAAFPFTMTMAASGTGTISKASTTAPIINTDYALGGNWSLNVEPAPTDNVTVKGLGNSTRAILWGLDQSVASVDGINAFTVLPDYNANIGQFQHSKPMYLKIDPDVFTFRGRCPRALIDIGSANIPVYVESNGSPSAGEKALYLLGSNITTAEIVKGVVGIAVYPNETATIATLLCAFKDNLASDVDCELGSGVTLTTATQTGGKLLLRCAATTVTNGKGSILTTEGTGAYTTMNVYGTTYHNSTGTIATCNLYGTLDLSGERNAKTITTLNRKPGSVLIRHAGITITTDNKPTEPGEFRDILVG